MKVIILCAGKGTRMLIDYPKSLIKKNNKKSLLANIFLNFKKSGFKKDQIIFATGYKENLIKKEIGTGPIYIHNKKYSTTNMVYTFMKAVKFINDDLIVSYSDLSFDYKNILKLRKNKNSFVTLVDKRWTKAWKEKGKLDTDSETLKIINDKIVELGKKTNYTKDIDARYVGVSKINKEELKKIKSFYFSKLKKNPKRFLKIDMTSFFNLLIKSGLNLYYDQISKKWNEYDDFEDLEYKHK